MTDLRKTDLRNLIMLKADYHAEHEEFIKIFKSAEKLEEIRKERINSKCYLDIIAGEFDAIIESRIPVDFGDKESKYADEGIKSDEFMRRIAHASRDATRLPGIHSAYPIFIVREWKNDDEAARATKFWDERKRFRFFTSLYLADDFFRCKNLDDLLNQLQAIFEESQEYDFLIYETMHVAEFMLCFNCDSIRPVLEAMQKLFCVDGGFRGYTRTICAMDYQQLIEYQYDLPDQPLNDEQKRKLSDKQKKLQFLYDEQLDYAYLQMVQSLPGYMQKSIAWIEAEAKKNKGNRSDPKYSNDFVPEDGLHSPRFIFGNEDYCINLEREHAKDKNKSSIRTLHFYEAMHAMIVMLQDEKAGIRKGISHLQTKIGVKLDKAEKAINGLQGGSDEEQNELRERCKHLLDYTKQLESNLIVRHRPWYKEFMAQAHILHAMSCSYIYDSVCYLLLDGAAMFCSWIGDLLKQTDPVLSLRRHEKCINDYLAGWARLASHMMRADAIMLPVADCIPPSDDMCTGVVEYCSVFFRRIGEYFSMQCNDPDHPRAFAHLLVPMLCRFTKTFEMFVPARNSDLSLLFFLEAPQQTIAEPMLMITTLGHEAAHYLGVKPRLQEKRIYLVCKCTALYLTNVLLKEHNDSIAQSLSAQIQECLYKRAEIDSMDIEYFDDLKETLKPVVFDVLNDVALPLSLARTYLDKNKSSVLSERALVAMIHNRIEDLLDTKRNAVPARYEDMVGVIYDLLKECYADIQMIDLLDLNPSEYIRLFSTTILTFIDNLDHLPIVTQRIAIVRQVLARFPHEHNAEWKEQVWYNQELCKSFQGRYNESNGLSVSETQKAKGIVDKILRESDGLTLRKEAVIGGFPLIALDAMIAFLEECLKEAHRIKTDEMEKIQTELREQMKHVVRPSRYYSSYAKAHVNYADFLRKGRQAIIDRLKGVEQKDTKGNIAYNYSFMQQS